MTRPRPAAAPFALAVASCLASATAGAEVRIVVQPDPPRPVAGQPASTWELSEPVPLASVSEALIVSSRAIAVGDLTSALYFQGYRKNEFAAV